MKIGKYEVEIINEGVIQTDGGVEFAGLGKMDWDNILHSDENNNIHIGINMMLIKSNKGNILVDAGIGTKLDNETIAKLGIKKLSNMDTLLKPHGLTPADINYVALTHLHSDHCGGITEFNGDDTIPVFQNADYIIQKEEWESVFSYNVSKSQYSSINYLPLLETKRLKLISGNIELLPGIFLEITGGHTVGHQIITIEDTTEDVLFLGDICPTPFHLSASCHEAFDYEPQETASLRNKLLCKAARKNYLVAFSHDLTGNFYRIVEENNKFKAVAE